MAEMQLLSRNRDLMEGPSSAKLRGIRALLRKYIDDDYFVLPRQLD